jgi:hypothetical protein
VGLLPIIRRPAGDWFARVVVFLLFAIVCGIGIGLVMPPLVPHADTNPIGFLFGTVIAWPLSSIPTYYRRWRIRQLEGSRAATGGFFG